jgi:hypothetical protein
MNWFVQHSADTGMFWNNDQGWVHLGDATKFTHAESQTLIPGWDGQWVDEEAAIADALSASNWEDDYFFGEYAKKLVEIREQTNAEV